MPGCIKSRKGNMVKFRAPRTEGAYRLFVWIYDGNDHVGYANMPFYTAPRPADMPQAQFMRLKKQTLDSFDNPTP